MQKPSKLKIFQGNAIITPHIVSGIFINNEIGLKKIKNFFLKFFQKIDSISFIYSSPIRYSQEYYR